MKIYVVTMYRWGNREKHSYVLGVWSEAKKAVRYAVKEANDRGGKYNYEIIASEVDKPATMKCYSNLSNC